jgi:hypothetical protein
MHSLLEPHDHVVAIVSNVTGQVFWPPQIAWGHFVGKA